MRPVFSVLGLGLVLLVVACKGGGASAPSGGKLQITADDKGFSPSAVEVKKGEPLELVFTRTTEDTCANQVVFPDLKVTKDLPLKQPVSVAVPTGEARTLTFQCGMGMYKSKVVVQ